MLLRVQKPSEIPVESLHSKKEDLGRTLRLTMREALSSDALGEFSVQPQQGETRAVFVPLKLLQKELEQDGKANLILVDENPRSEAESGTQAAKIEVLERILKDTASLEDYGIKLRVLNEQQALSVESSAGFILRSVGRESGDGGAVRGDVRCVAVPVLFNQWHPKRRRARDSVLDCHGRR